MRLSRPTARQAARDREWGLLVLVGAMVFGVLLFAWVDTERDRERTIAGSIRLTDSFAHAMERQLDASLQNAANAALSAAMLLEQNGGPRAWTRERLHQELKRELWDDRAVARLLLLDAGGQVLASSAEYTVPALRLPVLQEPWTSHPGGSRTFRLGLPYLSPLDGGMVLPFECDLYGRDGQATGMLRAELRVAYFVEAHEAATRASGGITVVLSDTGMTLVRTPYVARHHGKPAPYVLPLLAAAERLQSGNVEVLSREGVLLLASWRRVQGYPMITAVGRPMDVVLQPWRERAHTRWAMAGIGSALLVAFALALGWHLRRLERSESRARRAERQYLLAVEQANVAAREANLALERRVAERTAELTRANEDLEAFTGYAAHDLRGPLQRMAGFLDLMERDAGPLPPQAGRRLDTVRRQLTHMSELVENLLNLSRSSRAPLHRKPVLLDELMPLVIEHLDAACGGRRVDWRVGPLPRVRADRGLLQEALANLLGNAVKYTRGREPAIIEIEAVACDVPGMACVRIADNGAGFDMAHAGKLFVPFRRLHSASEFEGTGMGLAIVQRIVERHGGRIRAEGEPGVGATFWVTLPLDDPEPMHAPAPFESAGAAVA